MEEVALDRKIAPPLQGTLPAIPVEREHSTEVVTTSSPLATGKIQAMLQVFSPVSWADKAVFDVAIDRNPQRTSELTFVNIYAWAPIQYPRWAEIDGHLVVHLDPGNTGESKHFLPPIGPHPVQLMERLHREFGAVFTRIDDSHLAHLSSDIPVTDTPGDHDYLYSVDQIAKLEGKSASELRRRARKLNALGDAISTAEITEATVEDARVVVGKWLEGRIAATGDRGKADDAMACNRVLDKWGELPQLRGTLVYYQKEPVSLSIGEMVRHPETPDGTLIVHFEKSVIATHLAGLPVFSFQKLCTDLPSGCIINRMQSAGVAGLRDWKESWGPSGMRRKIAVGTSVDPRSEL